MGIRNRKPDFTTVSASSPPDGMPFETSLRLVAAGMPIEQQRLYFSPNAAGTVEWTTTENNITVVTMTPFRADLLSRKFAALFDEVFGDGKWKILRKPAITRPRPAAAPRSRMNYKSVPQSEWGPEEFAASIADVRKMFALAKQHPHALDPQKWRDELAAREAAAQSNTIAQEAAA